jgi:hypothetical protein
VFGAQMERWESVHRCSTCSCGLGFFLISLFVRKDEFVREVRSRSI